MWSWSAAGTATTASPPPQAGRSRELGTSPGPERGDDDGTGMPWSRNLQGPLTGGPPDGPGETIVVVTSLPRVGWSLRRRPVHMLRLCNVGAGKWKTGIRPLWITTETSFPSFGRRSPASITCGGASRQTSAARACSAPRPRRWAPVHLRDYTPPLPF